MGWHVWIGEERNFADLIVGGVSVRSYPLSHILHVLSIIL